MALTFTRINMKEALENSQEYWDAKKMLKDVVKHFPQRIRPNVWELVDREMGDKPVEELPQVFQNCATIELPFALSLVIGNTIQPKEILIRDNFLVSRVWKSFGQCVAKDPERTKHVVVFKLSYMGLWVCHDVGNPTTGMYMCLPAQTQGLQNITIEPMLNWAEREFHV